MTFRGDLPDGSGEETGGTTPPPKVPEWFTYIRIAGEISDIAADYEGMHGGGGATGAASAGGDTAVTVAAPVAGQPELVVLDNFPVNVWEAQALLIAQQSAYIEQVKRYFNERWQDISLIPKDLIGNFLTKIMEWTAGFVGETVEKKYGWICGKLTEVGVTLLGKYLIYITLFYTEGASLCDTIKKENTVLLTMPASRDNYLLRSQVITQHDNSIQNLLLHISTIEQHIDEGLRNQPIFDDINYGLDDINIGGDTPTTTAIPWEDVVAALHDIAMSEPVVRCPHTGECIYTKSLSRGR